MRLGKRTRLKAQPQASRAARPHLNSSPQREHLFGSLIKRKKKEKKQTRKKPRIVVTIAHAGILAGITAVEPHRGQTRPAGRTAGSGGGGSAVVGRLASRYALSPGGGTEGM
jgi:hypothetical protein